MNKRIVLLITLCSFVNISVGIKSTYAYDDKLTHPALTTKATYSSQLDDYLKQNFGNQFSRGIQSLLNGTQIVEFLSQGSTAEDHPMCQAANHFHNPLLPWNASQMSDDSTPLAYLSAEYCNTVGWPYIYRKSNVTWATGYLSPSPDGLKYMFLSSENPPPTNWDTARASYYSALTGMNASNRDADFAATFSALGHVLHLIQDMAVPAHVRNDFTSHIFPEKYGILNMLTLANYYSRYEHYVMNNNGMISALSPRLPATDNFRLTDFWDTNSYDGTNPSYSNAQGLAEFTNANFFSEFTIPFNTSFLTPEHTFPQPGMDYYGNPYHICKEMNQYNQIVQYLSRSTCPTTPGSGQVDHFLTLSLLNVPNGQTTLFWTDDKVHDTYAKELIPRALGYSAGLLNYFFRGSIDMTVDLNGTGKYILKNNSNETLSGTFSLYYDDTNNNRIAIPSANWSLTINANSQSVPLNFTRPIASAQKNPDTYMLVFNGQMGQEQGAVIGKMTVIVDPLLPAPTPISPLEGGALYDCCSNNYNINYYVSWSSVSGGNGKYEVSIDGGSPIVIAGTSIDSRTISAGTHTWKVRTQNITGIAGPWSGTISFTKYDYLPAPVPTSPNIGLSLYNPLLVWNSVPDATSYYVKIFIIDSGDPGDLNGTVYDVCTSITVNTSYNTAGCSLQAGKQYEWSIRGIDGRGVTGYGYPFTMYWIQTSALGMPSLSIPYNATTTIATNPILQWSAVNGADSYDVSIDGITYNTASASYTSSVGIGTHTWKVRARSNDGTVGNWSSSWSFTRANKYAAPSNLTLELKYNSNGGADIIGPHLEAHYGFDVPNGPYRYGYEDFVVLGFYHNTGVMGDIWGTGRVDFVAELYCSYAGTTFEVDVWGQDMYGNKGWLSTIQRVFPSCGN